MRGGTLAGFPEPLRGIPVRERPLTPSPPPILPPSLAHRGRNPIRKGRGWKWQELSNVYKPGFRPCRSPLSPPPASQCNGSPSRPSSAALRSLATATRPRRGVPRRELLVLVAERAKKGVGR